MESQLYDIWLSMYEAAKIEDHKEFKNQQMSFLRLYKRGEKDESVDIDRYHYMIHTKFNGKLWPWKIP